MSFNLGKTFKIEIFVLAPLVSNIQNWLHCKNRDYRCGITDNDHCKVSFNSRLVAIVFGSNELLDHR